MDRLARTRSQHFVHSPRKVASPLKLRHNSNVNRHPTKRRRLGSNVHTQGRNNTQNVVDLTTDSGSDGESPSARAGPSTFNRNGGSIPLNSEAGSQTINRNGRKSGSGLFANGQASGPVRKDVKGKSKMTLPPPSPPSEAVTFSSEDGSSPRKRKRGPEGSGTEEDSSSWIEMDEDEAEPEFIAEGDQHLIDHAPAYALHRLRKAELVRLWKVAGMWPSEDEEGGSMMPDEEDDDKGMSKRELVDGLIGARKPTGHPFGSSSSGLSHGHNVLDGSHDMRRGGSNNTQSTSWESSASSNEAKDIEITPRANPRTRTKGNRVRIDTANNGTKSVTRRGQPKGVRERLLKTRSKSMGGPGERDDRKARFGDVQSPAHGLLNRRSRRNSTMSSSVYTTTDTSPPNTPLNSRQQARKPRRSGIPTKRLGVRGSQNAIDMDGDEDMETVHSDDGEEDSDEADPTPLIQRLRPRTKSFAASEHHSEADADGEDEATEDEDNTSLFSPGPSSRLRSRDHTESDIPMSADESGTGASVSRSAGIKTKQEHDNGETGMEVDETSTTDKGVAHTRRTRRNSRLLPSPDPTDDEAPASATTSALSSPPASTGSISTISEETETEAVVRTTRSGKAFGTWQSRRRRLRQEAIDDPDMDVEDDDEAAESDEEEEDSFEADVDLSGATISSLTRFLRDELVQMCEARGIEVGGTKPQLAKALLEWRDEQLSDTKSSTSSQATARPSSSNTKAKKPKANGHGDGNGNDQNKIIHAIGSNVHKSGQTTPVLLRDHTHANDPATPPHSEDSKKTTGEAELNLDLQELGLEDSVIRPELLVKLERIGSGGFKDVYVGKYKNRKVAISEFREHLSEMDIRELQLLAEFSHPNIVKFRGICIPEDNSQIQCMLVSELCENGDLFDYIRNVPCPPLKRVLGLMLDIAKGLEYLHNHTPPIIHRDCKSSNILINRAGHAKVGDFGLARVKNSTRSMIRSLVGTVNWQAPELWSPKPQYDYKVDVFSAALVFWEMMSGWTGEKKYPWEGHNEHYIYDAVGSKHRRPSTAGLRKHWGTEPVNLMERMWHQDPKERPTMTDVVTDLEVLYAAA